MAQQTWDGIETAAFSIVRSGVGVQGRPLLALWPRSAQTCGPVLHQLPTRLSEVGLAFHLHLASA